jgi:hypothetical protein
MPNFHYEYNKTLESNIRRKLKFRGIIGDSSYEQQNSIQLKKSEHVNENEVKIREDFRKEKQDSSGGIRKLKTKSSNKLEIVREDSKEENSRSSESNIENSDSSAGINEEREEIDSKAKAKTNSWLDNGKFYKYERDPFFFAMTGEFFAKLLNHFKSKSELTAVAFIATLRSLVTQHLNKFWKSNGTKLPTEVWEEYLIYMRNKLYDQEYITGDLYGNWWFEESKLISSSIEYDSFEEMNKSANVKLDLIKLEQGITVITLKSSKEESKETQEIIRRDPETYAFVWYCIMSALCEKRFYFEKDDFVIKRNKYSNIVANLIKNYRNSKKITQKQAEIIDNDKNLKNTIVNIVLDQAIMVETDSKLHANASKMEEHINLVRFMGKEVVSIYRSTIERLLAKEVSKIEKGKCIIVMI